MFGIPMGMYTGHRCGNDYIRTREQYGRPLMLTERLFVYSGYTVLGITVNSFVWPAGLFTNMRRAEAHFTGNHLAKNENWYRNGIV